MNLKNLKIVTQLTIGFASMLFFVIVLGAISYLQSNKIHLQTEDMYNHPIIVQRAIGSLKENILDIRINLKDLFLDTDKKNTALNINEIEIYTAEAFNNIDILYSQYLGERSDIDSLKQQFIIWNSVRDEIIGLLRAGNIDEASDRTKSVGVGGIQAVEVLTLLNKIDDFAKNKADALYATSIELDKSLTRQLILLVVAILLLSLLVIYVLMGSINKPLNAMTDAMQRFDEGDMDARSSYESKNEFGVLSTSFNMLAEKIQMTMQLSENSASLSELMLREDEAREFFHQTLTELSAKTDSQMAATYLLSDDKKSFEHFESIGLDEGAKQSFSANSFEGEFGTALSTSKVQHIKNIPEDTRFSFHTVSGKFIPHEIITIPIHANNGVIAVISLASINKFSDQSNQLIDNILPTLSSRVEGILAYRKVKEFSEKLEQQNRELESQQAELSSQSAELIEQNAELEIQKIQLGEASKLKTNFLSNMSHELRTPLNSVIALSGVLNRRLSKQIPEEEYSYIEIIERNGKHLLNLINDILDISRIEAGSEEVEITKFNTNNLIAELVTMIRPQVQEKNIKLLHEGSSELFITSDANKCRHILQNLISNAIKFTEKGKVEVTTIIRKKNLLITITDTGVGIAEDHIPHIFDEFRQADGSTSRRFGGTGLGLAIAKKYANFLGGTINVKSILGKGSEFALSLPLEYSAGNQITKAETNGRFSLSTIKASHKTTSPSSVGTILIVDDSEPSIIQMKDFLEESGYNILVAHEGGEALEIIAQTIPDAIVLDLMMPNIDGFEVLKTLRNNESTAYVPVLILTAKHITKEELQFLKRNNIHQLIQKGDVNRSELMNAVATMLSPKTAETDKTPLELQNIEGKPLVLVVEDNPDNMTTAKAVLADKFTVLEATDGKTAIELAKQHLPNLILMDIDLPVMNGIEAFKAIRSNARLLHIPIIALTASAMVSDRETILAHGFDAYLVKPIDETIFFKVINETLYGK
jgi:signal transduction histidine kinase/CheY-like chemotaxis protein/HAMP domain-containing protein